MREMGNIAVTGDAVEEDHGWSWGQAMILPAVFPSWDKA